MEKKYLLWIIPILLVIAFGIGSYMGYTDETLNLQNSINFCESLNDPFIYSEITHGTWKWCSSNSERITCSSGSSCFKEEGSMQLWFDNPSLFIREINYNEGENYPNPFTNR